MNVNKVLYNIDQTGDTSASQKETARKNKNLQCDYHK